MNILELTNEAPYSAPPLTTPVLPDTFKLSPIRDGKLTIRHTSNPFPKHMARNSTQIGTGTAWPESSGD